MTSLSLDKGQKIANPWTNSGLGTGCLAHNLAYSSSEHELGRVMKEGSERAKRRELWPVGVLSPQKILKSSHLCANFLGIRWNGYNFHLMALPSFPHWFLPLKLQNPSSAPELGLCSHIISLFGPIVVEMEIAIQFLAWVVKNWYNSRTMFLI